MHGQARAQLVEQRPTGRLAGSLLAVCVVLTVLLLSQQSLQGRLPCSLSTIVQEQAPAGSNSGGSGGTIRGCQLPSVEDSPWAESCLLLRDACVDQGSILLYGQEHRMVPEENRTGSGPYMIEPDLMFKRYIFLHRNSSGRDYRYALPPIKVRPASSQEGTAYLADPAFSACTVPIVWYPMWAGNVAHMFRDNAAKMWGLLEHTSWAAHAKFVLVTAEGHAAPAMNHEIMQPMTSLSVETLADFTSRLPSAPAPDGQRGWVPAAWTAAWGPRASTAGGAAAAAAAAALTPSFEGPPQRCFRHMFVCPRGVNITHWPLHSLGQHLARHYSSASQQQPAAKGTVQAAAEQQAPNTAAASARGGSSSGGDSNSGASSKDGGSSSSSGGERVVRVVFHKRSTPDRQLLNAAELVEQCNSWRHTTAAGRRLRATCREVEMGDLQTGIAAAQEADIFVGIHGANMMNGWLMRPGSSMIELQPFGFDAGAAHLQYPLFNQQDNATQVAWWMISECDPEAWTPGASERKGLGRQQHWPKFRNMRLRWEALEEVLQTAVEWGGDMADYRRRWEEGSWWWWATRNGMQHAGKGQLTKMRCPAEPAAAAGGGKGGDGSGTGGGKLQ